MIVGLEVVRGLLGWGLWVWIAILLVLALLALFKVTPFKAAEPVTTDADDDHPPEGA